MLKNIGSTEIIIIAFLIIFLFGGKKIPEFIRGLSAGVREFKKASKDDSEKSKK